nr:Dal5 [Starmerella bombicola]
MSLKDNVVSFEKPRFEEKSYAIEGTVHSTRNLPEWGDVAAQYAEEGEVRLTPEIDRRLRWKADCYIMPVICLVYGIQFADKVIPSSASVVGLTQDLFSQSKTGYSWVGSSFYLGYLVFEFPMSFLMQKMPLSTYAGVVAVGWGILLTCTAACQTMESFIACRVLLGMLECGIQPAFTVVVTQWYKRTETFSRTCLWFCANGVGGMFVLSIAYGLAERSDKNANYYSMSPWRIIYMIMGLITILAGAALWYLLPNNPHEARFLTSEEKRFQLERIRHNNQGFGSHRIKPYQIKEALLDPRTWLYGLSVLVGEVPNGGITVFSTQILSGMGFKGKESLLMNLPLYAVEFVGMFIVMLASALFLTNRRLLYTLSGSGVALMSLALIAWGPNTDSRLAGLYISSWAGVISYVGFISMIESDAAGMTKKTTVNAILLMCYCAGNIIGPQVFLTREAPEYQTGKCTMAATQAAQFVLICILAIYNYSENKRRDKTGIDAPPEDFVNAEFADLTDKEMPWFRYSL